MEIAQQRSAKTRGRSGKRVALNIFLLKEKDISGGGPWAPEEFLAKPMAGGRARLIGFDKYELGRGEEGALYVRKPYSVHKPEWIDFVSGGLQNPNDLDKLVNKSYSALLLKSVQGRQFVLAFGHGRHMLDSTVVEYRFGLSVALNSIARNKIASIDKQTFDSSPRISRTQAIKASEISEYGIDAEQDMLRAIVDIAKQEHADVLGEVIAGMDSLKLSVQVDLGTLDKVLSYALQRFTSKDYISDQDGRASSFAWVDNIAPTSDKGLVDDLDGALLQKLKHRDLSYVWMAVPEVVDWEDVGGLSYRPSDEGEDGFDEFLDIDKFAASLRRNASVKTLKSRQIYMVSASGRPPCHYSAYNTIYAEIGNYIGTFILNAGSWFKVSQGLSRG